MWRTPPEPGLALTLRPGAGAGARRLAARSRDRQRIRLVAGLRSVARRANTGGRARRYEVLLCERAASVRSQLLAMAATLERVSNPEPETLDRLRWLLTDGCTSPLYNPDVPETHLLAALDRIEAELDTRELGARDRSWLVWRGVAPMDLDPSAGLDGTTARLRRRTGRLGK